MPQTKEELEAQRTLHYIAVGNAIGEAMQMLTLLQEGSDRTPEQTIDAIGDVVTVLGIANWHAERFRVYHRLLNSRIADRDSLS